jgi:hypothetical protein
MADTIESILSLYSNAGLPGITSYPIDTRKAVDGPFTPILSTAERDSRALHSEIYLELTLLIRSIK